MTKFGCDKKEAIAIIIDLDKLIRGEIKVKSKGICFNINDLDIRIHFTEVFKELGCKDTTYPIGGLQEFYMLANLWTGEGLKKRILLCWEIKDLLYETFDIRISHDNL